MSTIKLPYLGPLGKAALIAAWTKNELEKRLSWLSPTYMHWNPKLPWGTDYETLTEQPPGIPRDSTNARLEPWRRWNWITDGTPNKWLNVPYEYPWNMAAGQHSAIGNLIAGSYLHNKPGGQGEGGVTSDSRIGIATMDIAAWNPSSYEGRPAPSKSANQVKDSRTTHYRTNPTILPEYVEFQLPRKVKCEKRVFGGPFDPNGVITRWYTITERVWRVKDLQYDENNNLIRPCPKQVNPHTNQEVEICGTLMNWGESWSQEERWSYNNWRVLLFLDNRLTPATVRWNLQDEYYKSDNRHEITVYFGNYITDVAPYYEYSCDELTLVTTVREGSTAVFEYIVYKRPYGMKEEWNIEFSDEFKYGSYQKKTPYPCYRKKPRPTNRRYWEGRHTNLQPVAGAEPDSSYAHTQFDLKPECYGDGNVRMEVDGYDDAPNTWYSRYRYKPSQHWADGWGIRCESANFYNEPEFRIGQVFQSAAEVDASNLEKDPTTGNYNAYFWQGMHKELYPMFEPGAYVGSAILTDEGIPRTANPTPQHEEELTKYEQRTSTYVPYYTTPYIHGFWFTMPVHHYSANDLWYTLCRQKNKVWHPERPTEVVAALQAINIPGQPGALSPPFLSASLLDTTYIFNKNTLVPTDFVHASMVPLPVIVTATDSGGFQVKTPIEPVVERATLDLTPIAGPNGDIEDLQYHLHVRGGFKKTDGGAAIAPIINYYIQPCPTVRPEWATLANYPTGWEIHPDHYNTHQARLIGETEMNHRCEAAPNWLDTDGGFLFYYTDGFTGVNEATVMKTTYFYFLRQARLPCYKQTHAGMFVTVELLFRKQVVETMYDQGGRYMTYDSKWDVERYEIQLNWPDNQELEPTFDNNFSQKDTDPGRTEKEPSKIPSRWWGESTLPAYKIYKVGKSGDSVHSGGVEDKRDWQAHGPYRQTVTSIVTYEHTSEQGQPVPFVAFQWKDSVYVAGTGSPYSPDPSGWGHYEHPIRKSEGFNPGVTKTKTTTLELVDVKINKIFGPVYRGYGSGGGEPLGP